MNLVNVLGKYQEPADETAQIQLQHRRKFQVVMIGITQVLSATPASLRGPFRLQFLRRPRVFSVNIHHLQPNIFQPNIFQPSHPIRGPKFPVPPPRKLDPFNSTLQGINISHQTGKPETHRLKTALVSGICDRSQEGFFTKRMGFHQFGIKFPPHPGPYVVSPAPLRYTVRRSEYS